MIGIPLKLLYKFLSKAGVKKIASIAKSKFPHGISSGYYKSAEKSLKKELLNKEGYNRYVKSMTPYTERVKKWIAIDKVSPPHQRLFLSSNPKFPIWKEAELMDKTLKPLTYSQYKKTVKDTLLNVPRGMGFGKGSWGGIYKPRGFYGSRAPIGDINYRGPIPSDASIYDKYVLKNFPSKAKKLRKYGKVMVRPRVMLRDIKKGRTDVGIHELKHALQFNLRKNISSRKPFTAYGMDDYAKKFLKKNWRKEIDKGWYNYTASQVPMELSARASTLRAFSPKLLKDIMNNPRKYKHIREVDDILRFTGLNNFKPYLKNIWSVAPAGLLNKAVDYNE